MFVQIPRLRRAIVNRRQKNAPAFASGGDLSKFLLKMSCEQICRWETRWPRRGCWRRLSRWGRGFFLTYYNLTIIEPKGPVREDEHKATARHPFGKVSGIEKVLDFYSQRDPGLQHKVLYWIIDIMGEGPRGKTDFDHWIQEPTVLARVISPSLFSEQK